MALNCGEREGHDFDSDLISNAECIGLGLYDPDNEVLSLVESK